MRIISVTKSGISPNIDLRSVTNPPTGTISQTELGTPYASSSETWIMPKVGI